jgi:hypothetical protein
LSMTEKQLQDLGYNPEAVKLILEIIAEKKQA